MLSTSPGPDVEPYHSRQVVILRPEDWAAWIYVDEEWLRPPSGAKLNLETAVREGRHYSDFLVPPLKLFSGFISYVAAGRQMGPVWASADVRRTACTHFAQRRMWL